MLFSTDGIKMYELEEKLREMLSDALDMIASGECTVGKFIKEIGANWLTLSNGECGYTLEDFSQETLDLIIEDGFDKHDDDGYTYFHLIVKE